MSIYSKRAYTLTEVLVVLGVILLLGALSFPTFNVIRRRSYQSSCVANLRQLGVAVALYVQDNDGLFPRGGDPTDLQTDAWQTAAGGEYKWDAEELPPLTFVLQPYVKSRELWHCRADSGFDTTDMSRQPLDARPSSFKRFGMSYYYRTELTLKRKKDIVASDNMVPPREYGASAINVLADGDGAWHGGEEWSLKRYNVLMADGHVANLNRPEFEKAWKLRLD